MNEMQVTIAEMTPTSSQLIEPDQVPTLQTLVLAGESMSRAVIERLSPYIRLINAYGPAECAVFSTGYVVDVHRCLETGIVPIGRGYGCVTWVTDPDNVNHLTPVGEVGELLIEGPNVSSAYVADPEKTVASFIEDPKWLIEGSPFAGFAGRHARLYKTGDLVRYIEDGNLVFVGRKDTQVKLHGQRIELEEVEHQMQSFLPGGKKAVAEVIQRGARTRQHRNLSSATLAHAANMNIVRRVRVLQYASPSFDASIYEILMTLAMGGCLCVPSDYQRMNTPSEFAREAKAEVVIISPTAIWSMSPDEVPSLKTVVLVGEAIPSDVVETWSRSSLVMNGYGPGECTFCSTTPIDTQKWDLAIVGRAGGCVVWLTDPTDYNLLAPIGIVGEILIEGPVVGCGYLKDPERTAASFINDAKWLGRFRENGRGRLYRSGDLGMYNPDGSVVYMGRRDMQVKLRGQRIEMGEVEFNLQHLLPSGTIVVEVVKYGENERVTAFLALSQMKASTTVMTATSPSSILLPPTQRVVQAAQLSADLGQVLPSYMIPSVYLPLARVSTTSSGKIDWKTLKHAANSMSLVDIMAYGKEQSSTTEPSTTAELALQKAWASLLKISPDALKRETDFFQAGTDSVEAMKLVSMARQEGRTLNVAQIFASPQLCDMALWWDSQRDNDDDALENEWPAFALLDDSETETFIERHICEPHSIPREKIKDVYPATYDQVLVYSINHTVYAHFEVDERLDRARIVESWLQVVRQHDILRTVLVPAGNDQYWAVVRTGDVFNVDYRTIRHDSELHQIIDTDHASGLHPGSFLGKLFVLESANNGKVVIILKMNHTIFDGSCFALYWSDWQSAYERGIVPTRLQYQDVLCSRRRIDSYAAARQYWEDMLHGLEMQSLPTMSEDSTPERMGDPLRISRCLTHISPPAEVVLDSFIKVKAVWAVTLASLSGKRDVGFYHISNGRRLGGRRTEEAAGPLMQLYPMRAQLQSD
ncbi:TPA_exp: Uncharacterized protein A8136_0828 [Trichophyton benhamiae CBS 112371]|nr:TPA_exp: Uncharacterized protein A8136_0828 [Trichophyton benhamiae CBS 112371]